MNVEISEQEMLEYADKRMKKCIDKIVESHMKEIDWYARVDQVVFSVVERYVTFGRCNEILKELDREKLIESIAGYLANSIADNLIDGY